MDRIVGLLPSDQMAAGIAAIGRRNRQMVIIADVAQSAGHIGVPGGERKSRNSVIEWCSQP